MMMMMMMNVCVVTKCLQVQPCSDLRVIVCWRHSLLEIYFSQFYLVTLYQHIFFDMHLDRPSIHKEGSLEHRYFPPRTSSNRFDLKAMGEMAMVNPISLSICQTGPKLALRCGQPGGHRVPGTFPPGETRPGWTFGLAVFFCWKWRQQKFPRGSHVGLVGATKSGKSGCLRELVSRLKADIDYQNGGFWMGNGEMNHRKFGFFWRSFSFDSEGTR